MKSLNNLAENTKTVFKNLQMSLLYTKDVEEDSIKHLNPKYDISIEEISEHFKKEIENI